MGVVPRCKSVLFILRPVLSGLADRIPFAHRPALRHTALAARRCACVPAARASLAHADVTTASGLCPAIERRRVPILALDVVASTRRTLRRRVLVPIWKAAALAALGGARISAARTIACKII